jgi:hypothetical protein
MTQLCFTTNDPTIDATIDLPIICEHQIISQDAPRMTAFARTRSRHRASWPLLEMLAQLVE